MEIIIGPVNCALCGHQVWNGEAVEVVPDGNEPQYICRKCFDGFGSENHVLIKTKEDNH